MNKPFLINILNKKIREMKKIIIMKKKREKIITNREKIMNKNQARSISRIKILIKINCQSKTKINSIYNNIKWSINNKIMKMHSKIIINQVIQTMILIIFRNKWFLAGINWIN